MIISGTLFILILPILSPYRAGVDIFGMRYFETGVYLLTLGFFLSCKETFLRSPAKFPYLVVLLILSLSYFSYKSILRSVKHWTSGAKLSHELYTEFKSIKPDLVVHKGLSTSYLLGITYLEFPQIAIFTKEEWKMLEKVVHEKNLRKILLIEWKENKLFNKEIPTSIWESKFAVDFEIYPQNCSLLRKKKIIHFHGTIYDCK
ncbi:MAG: hypothetical protein N3A69_06720 [Leptospiraceae bacterium]|nr:hypothetical protein [Leptospiraceae bacterium]